MRRESEVSVQRRITTEWIAVDHVDVPMNRSTLIRDASGGFSRVDSSTSAQRIRLLAPRTQLPVRRGVDGQEVQPDYTLNAAHTADIQQFDWFFIDGVKYEVVFVYPDRAYIVRAEVAYRG